MKKYLLLTIAFGFINLSTPQVNAGRPSGEGPAAADGPIGHQLFSFVSGAVRAVADSFKAICGSDQNDLPVFAESCASNLTAPFADVRKELGDLPTTEQPIHAKNALNALFQQMEDEKQGFRQSSGSLIVGNTCARDVTRARLCINRLCRQFEIQTSYYESQYRIDPEIPQIRRRVVASCNEWARVITGETSGSDRPLHNTLGCPGSPYCRQPSRR